MVDLNGHEAGNGRNSQGRPTAHRDLLYSERGDVAQITLAINGGSAVLQLDLAQLPERDPFAGRREKANIGDILPRRAERGINAPGTATTPVPPSTKLTSVPPSIG